MYHYLVFLLFLLSYPLLGQHSYFANFHNPSKRVEVRLGESSYIVINGKTNVNKFHCYCDELNAKPLPVTVLQEADFITVKNAELILQTAQFDCENKVMTHDFQELLQSQAYPHIEIQILSLGKPLHSDEKLASHPSNEHFTVWVQALVRIIDNKHRYTFPVKVIDHSANTLKLQGSIDLNLLDFGIVPPKKLLGLIEVDPWVTIAFNTTLELEVSQP